MVLKEELTIEIIFTNYVFLCNFNEILLQEDSHDSDVLVRVGYHYLAGPMLDLPKEEVY